MLVGSFREAKPGGAAKVFLWGPSGNGKTYTSLALASVLAEGKRVAVIDTEGGKSQKYAHRWPFAVAQPKDHAPSTYLALLDEVQASPDFGALVIDSFTHSWMGKNGILDIHNRQATLSGNRFSAWNVATPEQRRVVERILGFDRHLICTARAHEKWAVSDGKPEDLGERPYQGKGIWYEFDIVGYLDRQHTLRVEKSDCSELDGAAIPRPGEALGQQILRWLQSGETADMLRRQIRDAAREVGAEDWREIVAMLGDDVDALQGYLDSLRTGGA